MSAWLFDFENKQLFHGDISSPIPEEQVPLEHLEFMADYLNSLVQLRKRKRSSIGRDQRDRENLASLRLSGVKHKLRPTTPDEVEYKKVYDRMCQRKYEDRKRDKKLREQEFNPDSLISIV